MPNGFHQPDCPKILHGITEPILSAYQYLCDSSSISICHFQSLLHHQDFSVWCGPLFRSQVVLPVNASIPFPTSARWKGWEFAPMPKIERQAPELDRKIRICTAASRMTGGTKITNSRVRYSHEREPHSFAHQGPRTLPLTRQLPQRRWPNDRTELELLRRDWRNIPTRSHRCPFVLMPRCS